MIVVSKGQQGKGFKDIVQKGFEMLGCGCPMGWEGSKNKKGLTNKKNSQRLTIPEGFYSGRNRTGIDGVSGEEKWKEKLNYENGSKNLKFLKWNNPWWGRGAVARMGDWNGFSQIQSARFGRNFGGFIKIALFSRWGSKSRGLFQSAWPVRDKAGAYLCLSLHHLNSSLKRNSLGEASELIISGWFFFAQLLWRNGRVVWYSLSWGLWNEWNIVHVV